MKIVITGSEGLIGKQLVKGLSLKYKIIKLDLKLGHDLNDEKFVSDFFLKNKSLYGLIICHGLNPTKNLLNNSKKIKFENNPLTLNSDSIRDYLETNLISPFNIVRHFIKNQKYGKIITVSSLYGVVSPVHYLYKKNHKHIGYCLSKSAIVMMTKYLATLYAKNFCINSVVLGGVISNKIKKEFVRSYSKINPKKRMMKVKEASGIFSYLLDENSSYTNGGVFTVDGGWTSW
jgi:NAD(P)-dependent dehydrogenase (short-subunit alcohol dehydrogenase family)